MDRRALGLAALLTGMTAAAGCGGGSQGYVDASVHLDGNGGTGGGGSTGQKPPPMMGAGSHKVANGTIFLVGNGPNSCTNQAPATTDRWCAYAAPSTLGTNGFDLWIVNATKAAAGTAISCNGSDPNCARLSTALVVDANSGVSIHRFFGDTLIYTADATATAATVYAWRPGWVGGRALTTNTGVACIGSASAEAALCLENRDTTTVATQTSFDLHAGTLPAQNGPPLAKLDTVLYATTSDLPGVLKFDATLSPDGTYVAWSARPTATGTENLKVQRIGDATATMVVTDVSLWTISPDGARWYWLKSFNYDTAGAASGTLQMAAFPGGATPTTVAPNVGDYSPAGNRGLIFRDGLTSGLGTLKIIADRDAPATVKTLDPGVGAIFDVSKDGTAAMYAKTMNTLGDVDLFVNGSGSSPRCALAPTPMAAQLGALLDSGGGAAWARFAATNEAEGMFTNIATCTSAKYAANVLRWISVGDEGFLYMDDSPDLVDGTLRYAKVASGALPSGPSVSTRADPVFAPLLPALTAVMYTVNAGGSTDGLYIDATLPFATGSPADGGTGG